MGGGGPHIIGRSTMDLHFEFILRHTVCYYDGYANMDVLPWIYILLEK